MEFFIAYQPEILELSILLTLIMVDMIANLLKKGLEKKK